MKRFFATYTAHLLVWGIFAVLNFLYFKDWLPQIGMAVQQGTLWGYIVITLLLVYAPAVYGNMLFLLPRLYLRKQYRYYTLAVALLVIGVCALKVAIDTLFITVPAAWLGTLGHYISTLPYLLFFMGLSSWQVMAEAHRKERQRADALEKMQTEAALKWLKAQINPHFLFNALHNIYTLAYIKSEETAPMILKLGNIMRYVMQQGNNKTVPIEEEINYVQAYLALQGLKEVNRTKTTIRIAQHATQVMIAPMLFINFIENAYKHGNLEDENGWIQIDWHISNTQIHFACRNTYNNRSAKDAVGGIGLENVQSRLQLLYPAHVLQINADNGVYVVDLTIPLS